MDDLIRRQSAKDAYCKHFCHPGAACPDGYCAEVNEALDSIPTADNCADCVAYETGWTDAEAEFWKKQSESFEWCRDCKEYDQEAHCCHRWTKVIRQTVEELRRDAEGVNGNVQE